MSYPVRGENVIVELMVDAVYYPVLCGTDCTFTREVEFVPIRTADSSLFDEVMPRREGWGITVNGVTKIENDTVLTFFYLLQTSIRRSTHSIRVTFEDEAGDAKEITGTVYIGSESITGPLSDYANATIEFKGTGAFTIQDVTPPDEPEYDYFSDYWTPNNGNNYIGGASSGSYTGTSYTLAATDTILEVRLEGTNYELVTGTPTNGERQCKFNTSLFRIEFPAALVLDNTQRVFVFFKRPL